MAATRERSEAQTSRNAAIASTAIHALLLILFVLVRVGNETKPVEWIEVAFAGEQASGTPSASVASVMQVRRSEPPAKLPPQSSPPPSRPAKATETVKVELPQRRMLEQEPPELPLRSGEKLSPDQKAAVAVVPAAEQDENHPAADRPAAPKSASDEPATIDGGGNIEPGHATPAVNQNLGKGAPAPFQIEGEAANRIVLHRVVPAFPEGVHQEAAVRIRFTVLPDGSVGSAVLQQKGEPRLEKAALDAFRQWRFNPLPPSAGDRLEQGVITFRFLLQ